MGTINLLIYVQEILKLLQQYRSRHAMMECLMLNKFEVLHGKCWRVGAAAFNHINYCNFDISFGGIGWLFTTNDQCFFYSKNEQSDGIPFGGCISRVDCSR